MPICYLWKAPLKKAQTGIPMLASQGCGSLLSPSSWCLICPRCCWFTSPLHNNSQISFSLQGNRELMLLPHEG